MKKEDISDLIDMVNEQRDSCGIITRDELIKNIQEIIQQSQTKEVSNEEIEKWAEEDTSDILKGNSLCAHYDCAYNGRIKGAKWMRDRMKE